MDLLAAASFVDPATFSLGVAADLCFFTKVCPAVSVSVSSATAPRRGSPPCPCLAPSRRSRTGTPGTWPQCWAQICTDSWRRGRAWTRRAAQPPTSATSWLCRWWPTEAAGWCWPCWGLVTMTWKVLLSKIMLSSCHTTHLLGCFLALAWDKLGVGLLLAVTRPWAACSGSSLLGRWTFHFTFHNLFCQL